MFFLGPRVRITEMAEYDGAGKAPLTPHRDVHESTNTDRLQQMTNLVHPTVTRHICDRVNMLTPLTFDIFRMRAEAYVVTCAVRMRLSGIDIGAMRRLLGLIKTKNGHTVHIQGLRRDLRDFS